MDDISKKKKSFVKNQKLHRAKKAGNVETFAYIFKKRYT